MQSLRPALSLLAILTVLTGVAYPALVTVLGQATFPHQANGSLVVVDGVTVGSELIGQPFDEPGYFHGRPSATSPPYNAAASTGSNLGPLNPALHEAVQERVNAIRAEAVPTNRLVPVDLVTTSGSGLDPHISPAAALDQAPRVARARGLPEERVLSLIEEHIELRTLGILGERRVNVLRLNLALDELAPLPETD